jgi:hypothetical protein
MRVKFTVIAVLLLASSAATLADTLVLTNGRRVEGELMGVSGREIAFEERGGGSRRMLYVPRHEIARIEFEEERPRFGFGEGRRDDTFGIPRGMRERQVNVTAREGWTDTGIDVRAGQQIYFQASGEWRWGSNRRDGAAGENGSPRNVNRPLPDRPAAALLGRVGDDGVFFIGSEPGPFRARSSGRLYLGINDDVFTDNSGAIRVTISY